MKITKLAAIDIGSNAIRLAIFHVVDNGTDPIFQKVAVHRAPIRIGSDVFQTGSISDSTAKRFKACIDAYLKLSKVHEVENIKICATSAVRSASNGEEIVEHINKSLKTNIEVINGKIEANYISKGPLFAQLNPEESYLFVDVGGGSTDISFIQQNKVVLIKSFKIGTVRLLQNTVDTPEWNKLNSWMNESLPETNINVIGSGGNINKLIKLAEKKHPQPLLKSELENLYQKLQNMSFEERIVQMNLREDRADVIVPACKIFLMILQSTGIDHIYVPKIGLADGLIRDMYEGRNS